MDILALLQSAKVAGLKVTDLGHQLQIRGPKSAESIVRQLMAKKHDISIELKKQAGWDPETAGLIQWYFDEGQWRLPTKSYDLTPWIRVIDPEKFKKALLGDISAGPSGPRNKFGALITVLRRLHELFGEEPKTQENQL